MCLCIYVLWICLLTNSYCMRYLNFRFACWPLSVLGISWGSETPVMVVAQQSKMDNIATKLQWVPWLRGPPKEPSCWISCRISTCSMLSKLCITCRIANFTHLCPDRPVFWPWGFRNEYEFHYHLGFAFISFPSKCNVDQFLLMRNERHFLTSTRKDIRFMKTWFGCKMSHIMVL